MNFDDIKTAWTLIEEMMESPEDFFKYLNDLYHVPLQKKLKMHWPNVSKLDIEGVINDMFTELWAKGYMLDRSKSLRGLLYTIVKRKLYKNQPTVVLKKLESDMAHLETSFVGLGVDLQEAFYQLKEENYPAYKVAYCRLIEKMKINDIAIKLNISRDQTNRRIASAKQILKNFLGDYRE